LEKDVENVLDKLEETDVLPITLNEIASKIGVSPSEIEKVIFQIVKKREMIIRVEKGEKVVDRKYEAALIV